MNFYSSIDKIIKLKLPINEKKIFLLLLFNRYFFGIATQYRKHLKCENLSDPWE